ncbi:MAG TPA: cation:proton antiporter [Micromonosporaceae bacterium]
MPTAPLTHHQVLLFLLQLAVLLAAALLLGRAATRLGLPAVVGELCAGVLLGPSVLAHVAPGLFTWLMPQETAHVHLLDAVAQLAVLLLVGVTAVHLDAGLIRRRATAVANISVAALVVPLAAGVATGLALPQRFVGHDTTRPAFALFLGVAMCVSAVPVIAKTLADMGMLHRDVGQLSLAAAAIDDAVGWFLLSLVSAMSGVGLAFGVVTLRVVSLAGLAVFVVAVARPLVRAVLHRVSRSADGGLPAAVVVVVILLGAATTHALQMEPVLGAFLAGVVVGGKGMLQPQHLAALRTVVLAVLAPIFMASAGLRIDLTAFREPVVLLAAVAVLAVAVASKLAGAYLGARASRLTHWEGVAVGAGMNARGAVGVVVAMVGLNLGVLTTATYTIIVFVAVVTSVAAVPLLQSAMPRIEASVSEEQRRRAWAAPVPEPVGR